MSAIVGGLSIGMVQRCQGVPSKHASNFVWQVGCHEVSAPALEAGCEVRHALLAHHNALQCSHRHIFWCGLQAVPGDSEERGFSSQVYPAADA